MAEEGSWPSIQKHGLLSTTALLDLFEVQGTIRRKIESDWRPKSVVITHPIHGKAVVRDQKPMPPEEIGKCLVDLTPQQWYEFINQKTFFWTDENRLNRLLNAWAYRDRSHLVLIVDTKRLVELYPDQIRLCEINSGFASYGGKRGLGSFKPIGDFPSGHIVWEFALEYSVPAIASSILRIEKRKQDKILGIIWEPKKP